METKQSPKLVSLLKKAYSAELETVQNYLSNSVWLDGLRAHEVAEALAKDVTEELGHAQRLAHRIKQIGERRPVLFRSSEPSPAFSLPTIRPT